METIDAWLRLENLLTWLPLSYKNKTELKPDTWPPRKTMDQLSLEMTPSSISTLVIPSTWVTPPKTKENRSPSSYRHIQRNEIRSRVKCQPSRPATVDWRLFLPLPLSFLYLSLSSTSLSQLRTHCCSRQLSTSQALSFLPIQRRSICIKQQNAFLNLLIRWWQISSAQLLELEHLLQCVRLHCSQERDH